MEPYEIANNQNIIKTLKYSSQQLNRKTPPQSSILCECKNEIYDCISLAPQNISKEQKEKYVNTIIYPLIDWIDKYQENCNNYSTKRIILNQVRGQIGNLIQEIKKLLPQNEAYQ